MFISRGESQFRLQKIILIPVNSIFVWKYYTAANQLFSSIFLSLLRIAHVFMEIPAEIPVTSSGVSSSSSSILPFPSELAER